MEKSELLDSLDIVDSSRISGDELSFTIEETKELILATNEQVAIDLAKFADKGNKQAGKRVRRYTKTLETLGRHFRKLSV